MIDAIAFEFQVGRQRVHLPERYGNGRGVCNGLRMWAVDGTWERVFTALMAQADADENLNWAVSVVSTIVRAHQHTAGGPQTGPSRPHMVLADKAYSSRAIRDHLRHRGIQTVMPIPADQLRHRQRRGSDGGKSPGRRLARCSPDQATLGPQRIPM